MKLSIIIPCRNNRLSIAGIVDAIRSVSYGEKEIILVDDCSTDGTRVVLMDGLSPLVDKVICHRKRVGEGAALRSGIEVADGDVILIQEPDPNCDPSGYAKLIEPIALGHADVVYGARPAGNETCEMLRSRRGIVNALLTRLSNMFSGLDLADVEPRCIAFRRGVLESLGIEENGQGFGEEIAAKVARSRCMIYEVAIPYRGDSRQGWRPLGIIGCLRSVYCILKYNLSR